MHLKKDHISEEGATLPRHASRRRGSRVMLTVLASGLSVLATMAVASPADAHIDRTYVPGGGGSVAVYNDHTRIQACDTREDGIPIQAQYKTADGRFGSVFDTKATTQGRCTGVSPGRIVSYRACKWYFCSAWVRA